MALEKQVLDFVFNKGVDTKEDPRTSMKPSRLENSIFTTGDLNKHPGRKLLPSAIDTGGNQSSGESVFVFNNELVRINGGTTYGLGIQAQKWTTKAGGAHYCTLTRTPIAALQNGTVGVFDQAVVSGIGVVAFTGPGGLHVTVYDVASGTVYQSGQAAIASSGLGGQPRCCVMGGVVLILWGDVSTGRIYSAILDSGAPTVTPVATNILTDFAATAQNFDAITYGPGMVVLTYPTTVANLKIVGIGPTGAVLASPAAVTLVAFAGLGSVGLLVQCDTAGNIYIVYGDTTDSSTKYIVRDGSFASVLTTTAIVTNGAWSGTTANFRVGASIELTANRITLMLSNGANDVSCFIGTAIIGPAGVTTAFSELPSTAGLVIQSDAVAWDGGAVFGVVNIDSNGAGFSNDISGLQSSAWMMDTTGRVVARGLNSLATASNNSVAKPRVARSTVSGNIVKMLFLSLQRSDFSSNVSVNVVPVSVYGISLLTATRVNASQLPTILVGATEYIGGGLPRIYDGQVVTEEGFALFPDLEFITDNGAGGNLSAGTYQWKILWSWIGSNGELVRGPVSIGYSKTLAANHSVTLRVVSMPLSMRDILPAGATVFVEFYRTQANGTTFNKVTLIGVTTLPQNITTFAGLTSGGVPFIDNLSDAAAAAGELLYTTNGILDWEAPPAYNVACAHQGRLLIVPSENPYQFVPSSQWKPGENVRFSSFTPVNIPSDTGPLLGIASLDGKIALLTQSAAYITLGDGPDQLGNNPYPPPQRVVGVDTGPLPGSPVAVTPLGIIYQSTKGLTLLDRALNQSFIGADVEAFTVAPWILRSITVHPTLQQIHFQVDDGSDIPGTILPTMVTSNGGYRLVLDYFYNQWTVDPAWGAQDAVIYQNNYVQVRSDGACFRETPGLFLDVATAYTTVLETPWVKLAGTSGFQRIYYIEILGSVYSDFTLKLEVAYSFDTTDPAVPVYNAADTVTLDTAAARAGGASGFELGGAFSMRHHLGTKCSSVKFRISDISIQGNGQGMGLTSISLQYGLKQGVLPLSAAQTA